MSTQIAEPGTVEDLAPVIVKESSTSKPPKKPKATAPVDDHAEQDKKHRDWYSGWCGPGPCRDGIWTNKAGETVRWCRHVSVNGVLAAKPYLVCACPCHDGQPLPDMTAVVEAWETAQALKKTQGKA
mgnify:CR=1 FL=1